MTSTNHDESVFRHLDGRGLNVQTSTFSPRSGYYFWKALMPLYLLTGLSMGTFHFDTDNLSDRYQTVSTWVIYISSITMHNMMMIGGGRGRRFL